MFLTVFVLLGVYDFFKRWCGVLEQICTVLRCWGPPNDPPMTPPPVSVTSRLSCRVFNPHFGTSEHSAFGQIRLSDKFSLGLNFDLGHAFFLIFYLNQIRNIFYFLGKTCFHHKFCHHNKRKKFFKISFLAQRGKKYLQNWSSPAA